MLPDRINLRPAKAETFFERHAWIVLLVVILFIGFFGVGDMLDGASNLQNGETVFMHSLTGMSWNELRAANPAAANLIELKFRSDGATLFIVAVLALVICLTGFRRREQWAWYGLWAIPLWLVLNTAILLSAITHPEYGTPVPVISGSVFFLVWVTMLGLSHRRFFRKDWNTNSRDNYPIEEKGECLIHSCGMLPSMLA